MLEKSRRILKPEIRRYIKIRYIRGIYLNEFSVGGRKELEGKGGKEGEEKKEEKRK